MVQNVISRGGGRAVLSINKSIRFAGVIIIACTVFAVDNYNNSNFEYLPACVYPYRWMGSGYRSAVVTTKFRKIKSALFYSKKSVDYLVAMLSVVARIANKSDPQVRPKSTPCGQTYSPSEI